MKELSGTLSYKDRPFRELVRYDYNHGNDYPRYESCTSDAALVCFSQLMSRHAALAARIEDAFSVSLFLSASCTMQSALINLSLNETVTSAFPRSATLQNMSPHRQKQSQPASLRDLQTMHQSTIQEGDTVDTAPHT